MAAPPRITQLVERFKDNLDAYKRGKYKEAQLRREFIDPFFGELGWDVQNTQGYAEAYKDVIHEDTIKIGGYTKAPDYCFRIGGVRKFFLEAKRPSTDVKDEISPAYQLRRYAWSAKLPLSILSDFEEFAIYDCRVKPGKKDKASTARTIYMTFDEYADRWEEITRIFSREAILKGSFDKYVQSTRLKRGTAEVDNAFLEEIERWRTILARNIALRNPGLSQRELNFAVQRTIDRIIFLRICEDRGIESYGELMALQNGPRAYRRLFELFRKADDRYNSGLFHFRSERERPSESLDALTSDIKVDDKVLRDVIKNLYYPDSPYEFSVLPADILGQVYERFLGSVIRLTPGHRAVVEEKPEVRKAGGVYYTPTYIVDYIVKNTVGNLVKGKKPGPRGAVSNLRILDPACGSGSFLLGAYQYLLDWHRDEYSKKSPEKWAKGRKPRLYQGPGGEWKLTTNERKRILLNNIYGVDIDSQAVEVTKLSLLLKVLEGENQETIESQLRLFQERALPDLSKNIKCGNSLIGPDFYEGTQMSLIDDEELQRINAFDWNAEFPGIMKSGGFDAVIGNPPYVRQESISALKEYFAKHYEAFHGAADLYAYFIERSIGLLRDGGFYSIIVSSSFLRTTFGEPLRRVLKERTSILRIVDFGGLPVFANAKDTYVCIPVITKAEQSDRVGVCRVTSLQPGGTAECWDANDFDIPQKYLAPAGWSLKSHKETAVFEKVKASGTPLGKFLHGRMFYGVKTGLNKAFVIDSPTRNALIKRDEASADLIRPLLRGKDIRRYHIESSDLWLLFTRRGVDIDRYPSIREHLTNWKTELTPKRVSTDKVGRKPGRYRWYEIQDDVAYHEIFEGPKIVFPDICKGPRFCLDTSGRYIANTAYALGSADLYLLGILNSRLFWFMISNISIPFGIRAGKYRYRLIYQYMQKVPICELDLTTSGNKSRHCEIKNVVQDMSDLHARHTRMKTGRDRSVVQRQIREVDQEVDRLVYALYGLTDEEVAVVESAVK